MTVEVAQFINNLNPALPNGASDPITEGDNHIRLIKGAILATFPAIAGQVTATHTDLSSLTGAATTGANGLNVVTQAATNNGTLAASTAQVQAAIGFSITPLAPINSPAFTGTPTAPTATPGTASLQLATTAFAAALNIVGTAAATASAAASAGIASAAATSAALSAGAAIWVTGSTYAVNARVTSPSNGRVYMSLAAGVSNTDPASDTRWLLVTTNRPAIAIIAATATAVSGTHYVMTNAAQSILTLPASPVTGSVVQVTFTNARTDNVIARNGSALLLDSAGNPLLEDMTVDVLNRSVILEYAFNTWRFYLDSTAVASSAVVVTVTQATDAAATATAAATAATTARTAIDNKYRGALAADPATRPDSTANQVGDEYFNTAVNLLKRFNGSIWLASDINTTNLAASTGAGLVGWIRSVTGALSTTLAKWLGWQQPSIFEFMSDAAIADCVSNAGAIDTFAAVQAAIDGTKGKLRALNGTYRLSAQPIIRGNCTGIVGEGAYTTVFDKRFNGDCFSSLTNGVEMSGFGIAGNGATYTGGGIVPQGYNTVIKQLRINDTADSPIIVNAAVSSNTLAATYLSVYDCFLNPTNSTTTFAVRSSGIDDAARPTARVFSGLSGGSSLVDFSGMNYAVLRDSLGTSVKFSSNAQKICMTNNRITSQANIDIQGVDHIIDGNAWGFGTGFALSINAAAANVFFGPSNAISIGGNYSQSIVDGVSIGSANPNNLTTQTKQYTFNWLGSTSNYSLGNGSNYAQYKQDGRSIFVSFGVVVNTTTSIATGQWSFQLPFKVGSAGASGPVLLKSSSGTYYSATLQVYGGTSVGYLYLAGGTAPMTSADLAFGTNATLAASITYTIATQ